MKKRTHDLIVEACGFCAIVTLVGFIIWVTNDALTRGFVG